MDTHSIDFAVIGLGAVGAATLYQLAKRAPRSLASIATCRRIRLDRATDVPG
jgi:glycine/D-amino acid oxidase-like deaminating enzyme